MNGTMPGRMTTPTMMNAPMAPRNNAMPTPTMMNAPMTPRNNAMPTPTNMNGTMPNNHMMPHNDGSTTHDDNAYLTRMYPADIRHVLMEVKKEIDNIDYEGSFIYDVYPDKTTIICISKIIYSNLLSTTSQYDVKDDYECLTGEKYLSSNPSDMFPPANSNLWMFYVVTLLVFNDIFDRRLKKNIMTPLS
jgi:hypothetical protein